MSFWSSISFNLAVLMNLLVAFFYPLEAVRGGECTDVVSQFNFPVFKKKTSFCTICYVVFGEVVKVNVLVMEVSGALQTAATQVIKYVGDE